MSPGGSSDGGNVNSFYKPAKHEDLLLGKGRYLQDKKNEKIVQREQELLEGCTFSPKLNPFKGQSSTPQRAEDVFTTLYEKSKWLQSQKKDDKTLEETEFEKNKNECTFQPNLHKTK